MRCSCTAWNESEMNFDWSRVYVTLKSAGIELCSSVIRVLMELITSSVFVPACFRTSSTTAGVPFNRASERGSSKPSTT